MSGRAGTAIALDVATGRIVAIYKPEVAARRLARPGSTIKPFTLAALLDVVAALAYSCNNDFASAPSRLRDSDLAETFTRAGLVSRTGLYSPEAVGELT